MTAEGLGLLQSRVVRVRGHDIRLREFTTEQYSEVKSNSIELVRGRPKANMAAVEANSLFFAIDHSTWPQEFGPLTVDTIRKLPARITKPLIAAIQELNRLSEDEADFLPSKSQSASVAASLDSSTPSSSQEPVSS